MRIEIAAESAELLPDRALLLPGKGVLVVSDVHLGKEAAFRAAGLPVPEGAARDDLDRIARLMERSVFIGSIYMKLVSHGPRRILIRMSTLAPLLVRIALLI